MFDWFEFDQRDCGTGGTVNSVGFVTRPVLRVLAKDAVDTVGDIGVSDSGINFFKASGRATYLSHGKNDERLFRNRQKCLRVSYSRDNEAEATFQIQVRKTDASQNGNAYQVTRGALQTFEFTATDTGSWDNFEVLEQNIDFSINYDFMDHDNDDVRVSIVGVSGNPYIANIAWFEFDHYSCDGFAPRRTFIPASIARSLNGNLVVSDAGIKYFKHSGIATFFGHGKDDERWFQNTQRCLRVWYSRDNAENARFSVSVWKTISNENGNKRGEQVAEFELRVSDTGSWDNFQVLEKTINFSVDYGFMQYEEDRVFLQVKGLYANPYIANIEWFEFDQDSC